MNNRLLHNQWEPLAKTPDTVYIVTFSCLPILFIFQEYLTKFDGFHNKQLTLKDYSFGSATLESALSVPYLLYIPVGSSASFWNAVVSFPTLQSAYQPLLLAVGFFSLAQCYIAVGSVSILIIILPLQNHVGLRIPTVQSGVDSHVELPIDFVSRHLIGNEERLGGPFERRNYHVDYSEHRSTEIVVWNSP